MTQTSYVAVAGATGAQGGATARALLRRGVRVRALTRRPDSVAAQALAGEGADVAYADFTDPASLSEALAGSTALFAVTTPFGAGAGRQPTGSDGARRKPTGAAAEHGADEREAAERTGVDREVADGAGVDREVADGVALLDAAVRAGVGHIVYTSAANADRHTGIPHFDSKRQIELHLAGLGVPWTVIAPAAFMDQYAEEWTLQSLRDGWFGRPMPPDKPLPLICAADIGAFAALALTRREEFAGRRIDIAGDVCTGEEIAATLGRAIQREVTYRELPLAYIARFSVDLAAMFAYFGTTGLDVDVTRLRHEHPEVHWRSLAEWTSEHQWS